jgi:hypothetical protein
VSVFAAAWAVAALAALVPLSVPRLCIAGTVGGRGVGEVRDGEFFAYPLWFALHQLKTLGSGLVRVQRSDDRVAALVGGHSTLLGIMADSPVELPFSSSVTVWHGSPADISCPSVIPGGTAVPSPSIVIASSGTGAWPA